MSFTCSFFALSSSVLVEVLLQLHPTRPNAPKAISAAMQIAAIRRARFSANALALAALATAALATALLALMRQNEAKEWG
ncbi:MAG: hypothetical protein E6760_03780 [Eggerthella sp.]|nr:hypothetical protein [Eggerthella sp.]